MISGLKFGRPILAFTLFFPVQVRIEANLHMVDSGYGRTLHS